MPDSGSLNSKRAVYWENTPNYLAILAAIVLAVLDLFSATPNKALDAVAGVLVLMCTYQIVASIRRAGDDHTIEALQHSMANVISRMNYVSDALRDHGRIVECPENEPSVYVDLFGGFSGDYYAYNPAYAIEANPGLQKKLIDEVYVPRYKGNCRAYYLFYTADEDGKENLKQFKDLMEKVAEAGCEIALKKVSVKQNEHIPAASHTEIYFGTQHGRKVVVHDLSMPVDLHGRPSFYCTVESDMFFSRCSSTFNNDWHSKDAEEVPGFAPT